MRVKAIAAIAEFCNHAWNDLPSNLDIRICKAADLETEMTGEEEIIISENLPKKESLCKNIRWLQLVSSGTEQLHSHPLSHLNLKVTNTRGIHAVAISEFIIARTLEFQKKLKSVQKLYAAKDEAWSYRSKLCGDSLRNKKVLIIGYGAVGRETARLFNAFGADIDAVNQSGERTHYNGYLPYLNIGDLKSILPTRMIPTHQLNHAIPNADIIIITASMNKSNLHLFGEQQFSLMKPNSFLINISRGALVDETALCKALNSKKLAHACLDVFKAEPLPASSQLWNHQKISISPHISGVMPDDSEKIKDLFLSNFNRYINGKELFNLINNPFHNT